MIAVVVVKLETEIVTLEQIQMSTNLVKQGLPEGFVLEWIDRTLAVENIPRDERLR